MKTYAKRDCPGCNTSNTKAKLVARSEPRAEEMEFDELREYWRGFRNDSVFFSYFRCNVCKLVYAPVYFNQDQLAQLYSFMDDNSAGVDLDILRRTQDSYFKILKSKVTVAGRWLEYGADIGLFSELITNEPNVSSFTIVEPNLKSHVVLKHLGNFATLATRALVR